LTLEKTVYELDEYTQNNDNEPSCMKLPCGKRSVGSKKTLNSFQSCWSLTMVRTGALEMILWRKMLVVWCPNPFTESDAQLVHLHHVPYLRLFTSLHLYRAQAVCKQLSVKPVE